MNYYIFFVIHKSHPAHCVVAFGRIYQIVITVIFDKSRPSAVTPLFIMNVR